MENEPQRDEEAVADLAKKAATNLYEKYGTNKDLEKEGVILDFGGPRFKVRRAGGSNRKYAAAFAERTRPHAREMRLGTLSKETSDAVLIDVYFESVVVSWENVTDREGKVMEYNRANFKKLMADLPDLWDTLREEADVLKNFQQEQAKEDGEALGN